MNANVHTFRIRLGPAERRYFALRPIIWTAGIILSFAAFVVIRGMFTQQWSISGRLVTLLILSVVAVLVCFFALWHVTFRQALRNRFTNAGYKNVRIKGEDFTAHATFASKVTGGTIERLRKQEPDIFTRCYRTTHNI